MAETIPLEFSKVYHIYNRGVNHENIFIEQRNYDYFLKLYVHHVEPVVRTYAYCLMKNHFHLLVQVKDFEEIEVNRQTRRVLETRRVSTTFGRFSTPMPRAYNRTGSLLQRPFGRILVDHPDYFHRLIHYIHFNPQKHGFTNDFRDYTYSSYGALVSTKPTRVDRNFVMDVFDGRKQFVAFHRQAVDVEPIRNYIGEDDDL